MSDHHIPLERKCVREDPSVGSGTFSLQWDILGRCFYFQRENLAWKKFFRLWKTLQSLRNYSLLTWKVRLNYLHKCQRDWSSIWQHKIQTIIEKIKWYPKNGFLSGFSCSYRKLLLQALNFSGLQFQNFISSYQNFLIQ